MPVLDVPQKMRPVENYISDLEGLSRVARAEGALVASRRPGLREVHVSASSCGVRLTGSVPSYYEKQIAQEVVMAAGVFVLANDTTIS